MVMVNEQTHINHPLPPKSQEEKHIWKILETVNDPEIPVLSILDLGIVRSVEIIACGENINEKIIVTITPTYSGCPAMDMIAMNIRLALHQNGHANFEI
jgi:ring-1,2-phenylacetyl-CoA epoxidase subunit PaaD